MGESLEFSIHLLFSILDKVRINCGVLYNGDKNSCLSLPRPSEDLSPFHIWAVLEMGDKAILIL